jgi:hypothetical protein
MSDRKGHVCFVILLLKYVLRSEVMTNEGTGEGGNVKWNRSNAREDCKRRFRFLHILFILADDKVSLQCADLLCQSLQSRSLEEQGLVITSLVSVLAHTGTITLKR